MNDLLERLRTTKPTTAAGHVMRLAADRIEQLEAELASLKSQVKVLREALNLVPKNILSGQTHRIVINALSETEVKPKVKR